MDAGKLNERVKLLRLAADGTKYQWAEAGKLWAAAEQKEKTNLFSSVGIGARSAEFIVRRCGLTLRDAFLWRGKHCFLTSIVDEGKLHWKITAALIEPAACAATRPEKGKGRTGQALLHAEAALFVPGVFDRKISRIRPEGAAGAGGASSGAGNPQGGNAENGGSGQYGRRRLRGARLLSAG